MYRSLIRKYATLPNQNEEKLFSFLREGTADLIRLFNAVDKASSDNEIYFVSIIQRYASTGRRQGNGPTLI